MYENNDVMILILESASISVPVIDSIKLSCNFTRVVDELNFYVNSFL